LENTIREAIHSELPGIAQLLSELVRIPSLSGTECDAMEFLYGQCSGIQGEIEKLSLSDELLRDPDYSDPVPGLTYDGRFNLRLVRPGQGRGRSLILNSHVDVVPPSDGMEDPWSGKIENGTLYGRGACDAKGQVATILLVFKTLDRLGVRLRGDLVGHLVVEEENGGNGTLAMVRRGESADACIVLEPSDRKLYTSIRGAVWFRLIFHGKAGHSGQAGQTRSALLMARDAMHLLEQFHRELLDASRGFELFDPYPNPMPLTFGRLQAGNWPASAPNRAVLEGVLGLLPNKAKEDVCREIEQVLVSRGGFRQGEDFELKFMYRHDCSVLEPSHPLPRTLLACAATSGSDLAVSGMTASCDAWFYSNQLNIPTVVYGPGSLKVAHSKDGSIELEEIARAAESLARFAIEFCGEME